VFDLSYATGVQPSAAAQRVTQKTSVAKLVYCLCPKRGLTRADGGLDVQRCVGTAFSSSRLGSRRLSCWQCHVSCVTVRGRAAAA
jgi:hypothetical protein